MVAGKPVKSSRITPRRKVVHVTTVHSPGDPRILEKECRSLSNNGYEVVVVAPQTWRKQDNGVRTKIIRCEGSRAARLLFAGWRALFAALGERSPIYHLHDPELLIPFQLARLLGATVVFDMHEHLPKAIVSKEWIWPPARSGLAWLAKAAQRVLMAGVPVVFAEESYGADYRWIKKSTTVLNYPK